MSKHQFTDTAAQPQHNRKLCKFNNDQYCTNKQEQTQAGNATELVIIKLTKNPVSLRFRCGSCILKFCRYFTIFCDV